MKVFPWYVTGLTAAFVALDVTGKIDWPWWAVTLPLLVGIAMSVLIAIVSAASSDKG